MKSILMKKSFLLATTLLLALPVAKAQAEIEAEAFSITADVDFQMDFGVDEAVDPVVRDQIIGLRGQGIMGLQSRIGTDLLLIDRLQRRAQAVEQLIRSVGIDGLHFIDPELHASLQNSPIFIRQQIEELRLQRELEDVLMNAQEEEELQEFTPPPGGFNIWDLPGMAQGMPPAVEPVMPEPEEPDFSDLFPEEEIVTPPEPEIPVIVDFPISLREILGSNGVFRAVILHGEELIRVEQGDRLPNDTEIMSVNEDRIQVRRRDTIFDLHIRG